jgi:hypothetical protein
MFQQRQTLLATQTCRLTKSMSVLANARISPECRPTLSSSLEGGAARSTRERPVWHYVALLPFTRSPVVRGEVDSFFNSRRGFRRHRSSSKERKHEFGIERVQHRAI